jgi:hypothetical protein
MNATKSERTYRQDARLIATMLFDGRLSLPLAQERFRDLIEAEFTGAYARGMERANVPYNDETAPIVAEDLEELIEKEWAFLPPMLETIQLAQSTGTPDLASIRVRLEGWVSRLRGIEERGFIAGNQMGKDDGGLWLFGIGAARRLKWVRNPMKDSCRDCIMLDGRVYTAKTWQDLNIYPQSSSLACFGEMCGCEFVEVNENLTSGQLPRRWA